MHRKQSLVLIAVIAAMLLLLSAMVLLIRPSPGASTSTPATTSTSANTSTTTTTTAEETTTTTSVHTTTTTTTTTTTKVPTTTTTTAPPSYKVIRGENSVHIQAPLLCQYPEYPSGCEATATVMALRYAGESISVAYFIDNYLACSRNFYWEGGKQYGPSPYEYFLGDPRSENSYGCMSPVIKKALIRHFGSDKRVIDAGGTALSDLCEQYIDKGVPVIIWAGIGMSPILKGASWTLPDGTLYTWPSGEHCLLLVGYDNDTYYLNDPTHGRMIRYKRWIVEERYADLGKQALVIK